MQYISVVDSSRTILLTAILEKWVPYSQRYLVLGLVLSRVSVMVSVRDSVK